MKPTVNSKDTYRTLSFTHLFFEISKLIHSCDDFTFCD